jgi:hypothetical protein
MNNEQLDGPRPVGQVKLHHIGFGLASIEESAESFARSLEPVINFIPLESRKSAGVWSWWTMKGWETEVGLVIRVT